MVSFVLMITLAASAQTKKAYSKINILGMGYGLEYFFNPKIAWHNELGFSFWEKVIDQSQDESTYEGIAALNPYFSSSFRYYVIPIRPIKKSSFEIGLRISASYTGMYSTKNFMQFTGENKQQLGIFAGTSMRLSKLLYLELELGPAYQWNDFATNKMKFLGNFGVGFIF